VGKIFRGIFPKIFPTKNVRKIGPWLKSRQGVRFLFKVVFIYIAVQLLNHNIHCHSEIVFFCWASSLARQPPTQIWKRMQMLVSNPQKSMF
jgi:hypothetical protein